ncbi:hypothetical protein [Arthrobacter roseus]|uniref:hypothetical protein n=1 Tax=Arthrobacter roseus TaxID=136274 RepID=UPI00196644C9|nr:hypothetical protein [Arthrobacter roseus]MBM7849753.1 putative membrane protein YagU involved in acid resistance [Arthrobacter roseus]
MSTNKVQAKPGLATYVLRGAIGGIVGGAVFIGVTMWFSATQGNPPAAPFGLISSIVLGADSLMAGAASVPLGVVIHTVNSLIFGIILGLVAARLPGNASIAVVGLVYGLLLYLVNFQLIGRFIFPQFQMPNQPFEVLAHLVFGAVAALFLFHRPRHAEHR